MCRELSFLSRHLGDDKDSVQIRAAVAHSLPHPAELSRHVAEPVDRFVGVVLDDGQDLVVLVFRHIQQLGDLLELQVQLPDTGALWGVKAEGVRSAAASFKDERNTSCDGASPVSKAPWQTSHWLCSCQHSEDCLRRSRHNFLFCRKRDNLSLAAARRIWLGLKAPSYPLGVSKYSAITGLLLHLHRLRDAVKDLRHHSSELVKHALPKVIEGIQHLLQPHPLQEARVSAGTVGVIGRILCWGVQIIQERLLEDFAKLCSHPGGLHVTAGHQGADFIGQTVKRFLDADNLGVRVVDLLVDQDVPRVSAALTIAKAAGYSAKKVLHLKRK